MQFFEVIEFLSVQLNLPQLVPSPQGTCAVRFDGVIVSFTHDPLAQAFEIRSELGQVAAQDEPLLGELLAANAQAESSSLGCNADGHASLRQRFSLPDLALPRFFGALERFVNRAEHWQDRLQGATPERPNDRAAGPSVVFA